ncbi:MAG: hypothetical protein WBB39_02605 [Candidatus Saccharimonadales bacterium]
MWLYVSIAIIVVCFGLVVVRGAPYVPSHRHQLRRAFGELHPLSDDDVVVDLGSGDGVVLREARRSGASAIGYELNPLLVGLSRVLSRGDDKVRVLMEDYLRVTSLPCNTTVVYAFTTGRDIVAIDRKLQQWSRDQTVFFISYGFTVPDKRELRSLDAMHLYKYESISV